MKSIELHLPSSFDNSFTVFSETGKFFPCPWHYHPEYELCQVVRSRGRRFVGDHIGNFEEGDLVLMGPNLPHVWVNDTIYMEEKNNLDAEAIVIHFYKNFLGEKFFDIPELDSLKKILTLSHRGIAIRGDSRNRINDLMKKMTNKNGLQRLALLIEIFCELSCASEVEVLASPDFSGLSDPTASSRFKAIIDYTLENFNEEIPIEKMASLSNMGLTTFCNLFKKNYRMTYVEYLNYVRIGHACKLLSEDNLLTISEVAYKCGFNTLANFNRQFKKIKNMTPTTYKENTILYPKMLEYFNTEKKVGYIMN